MDRAVRPEHVRQVPTAGKVIEAAAFFVVMLSWLAPIMGLKNRFLTAYAGDLFGAIFLYTSLRLRSWRRALHRRVGPFGIAVFVFAGCTGFEMSQKFHWVTGWYDPIDILCYAAGVILCLCMDAVIRRTSPAGDASAGLRNLPPSLMGG